MLFSERSVWTMVHGIGLGGAALLGLAACHTAGSVQSSSTPAARI